MANVINLFSPGENIDLEPYRDQLPGESYEYLRELLTCNPGDILRAVFLGGQFIGAMKLAYSPKRHAGFMRCLIIRPGNSPLQDVQFHDAAKESVSEFIRLCFNTYRQLKKIYWNVHPEDKWIHKVCHDLTFTELDSSSAFVNRGIKYRSFFLERLK